MVTEGAKRLLSSWDAEGKVNLMSCRRHLDLNLRGSANLQKEWDGMSLWLTWIWMMTSAQLVWTAIIPKTQKFPLLVDTTSILGAFTNGWNEANAAQCAIRKWSSARTCKETGLVGLLTFSSPESPFELLAQDWREMRWLLITLKGILQNLFELVSFQPARACVMREQSCRKNLYIISKCKVGGAWRSKTPKSCDPLFMWLATARDVAIYANLLRKLIICRLVTRLYGKKHSLRSMFLLSWIVLFLCAILCSRSSLGW